MTSPAASDPDTSDGVVRELFTRLAAGDFDRMLELLDDEIEFDLAFQPAGFEMDMPVRGRDAVRGLLDAFITGTFDGFTIAVSASYPGGDDSRGDEVVVAEYASDATVRHNGKPYQNRYVGIFRLRDKKIYFWREYANPEVVTRAMS